MKGEKYPQICDYEGSDYQTRFWDKGGRAYEDGCERLALKRLLPKKGKILLELGAGAGRNTQRYTGFERVVLLDYSYSQLLQAREKLGKSQRYIFVVADIYKLPFVNQLFDCATMIRVIHHMVDAPYSLRQIHDTLQPGGTFILEYANKQNIKSVFRYALHHQTWNPFSLEPVEFAPLNFNFHPHSVHMWLSELDFTIERTLTVSHFRINILKKSLPTALLIWLDSLLQWTGALIQLTPSVFLRARVAGEKLRQERNIQDYEYFKCPKCQHHPLDKQPAYLACTACGAKVPIENGIYNFKDA